MAEKRPSYRKGTEPNVNTTNPQPPLRCGNRPLQKSCGVAADGGNIIIWQIEKSRPQQGAYDVHNDGTMRLEILQTLGWPCPREPPSMPLTACFCQRLLSAVTNPRPVTARRKNALSLCCASLSRRPMCLNAKCVPLARCKTAAGPRTPSSNALAGAEGLARAHRNP